MRLALLLLFVGAAPRAQTPGVDGPAAPPTGVMLAAGPSAVVAGGFGDAWRPGAGLAARGEVSAYGGVARGAAVLLSFDADDPVPPFTLAIVTAGWGVRAGVGPAEVVAGPSVGVVHVEFPDAVEASGAQTNETETVVGAFAGLRVPLTRHVLVWADAEALRVALAPPRGLLTVGGGVALRFDVPAAVGRALR